VQAVWQHGREAVLCVFGLMEAVWFKLDCRWTSSQYLRMVVLEAQGGSV
jgi:hypothetical protein